MADLFELKMEDSPFPQAMDVYYDQLIALVSSPSRQKVALVSNLTECPLRKDTPLYDKYVTRSFADRCVESGSPETTPDLFFGPASFDDAFSSQYQVLVNRAVATVDVKLSADNRSELELSRRRVTEKNTQIDAVYDNVLNEWEDFKKNHFPGKGDDDLILERVSWFSTHRLARQLQSLLAEVDRELVLQQSIAESVGDPNASLIYKLKNNFENDTVYLCKEWRLEQKYKLDEIAMSDPLKTLGSIGWADKGVDIDALVDFDQFLSLDGVRSLDIAKNQQSTSQHEQAWNASASFSYGFFFHGNVSTSDSSKVTASLKDTMSIHFGFKRIGQLWIRRGDWYSSALFAIPAVQKLLTDDKRLAARLKYVVSSIIVGRGLSLKIGFDHVEQASYFHQWAASGSASFLGILPLGSGGTSGTTQTSSFLEKEKAVEFTDDPSLCRVLGFTVEPLHDIRSDKQIRMDQGNFVSTSELISILSETHDFKEPQLRQLATEFV